MDANARRFLEDSKGLNSEPPFDMNENLERAYGDAIRGARASSELVVTRGRRIAELEEEVQRLRSTNRVGERIEDLKKLLEETRQQVQNLANECFQLRQDLYEAQLAIDRFADGDL